MYFIEESKGKAIVVETIHTYLRSESCGSGKFQVSLLLNSKGRNPKEELPDVRQRRIYNAVKHLR